MNLGQKNGMVREAVIGSLIFAIMLVAGTLWMGRSASRDTDTAVRSVSLLYLDELAGRRAQVVASTLGGYISNLDVAIGLMTKEDLSSVEKLQAYQARMKQLYGLEKFAFVNNDGLIYTSRGTRTDIDQYPFDCNSPGRKFPSRIRRAAARRSLLPCLWTGCPLRGSTSSPASWRSTWGGCWPIFPCNLTTTIPPSAIFTRQRASP